MCIFVCFSDPAISCLSISIPSIHISQFSPQQVKPFPVSGVSRLFWGTKPKWHVDIASSVSLEVKGMSICKASADILGWCYDFGWSGGISFTHKTVFLLWSLQLCTLCPAKEMEWLQATSCLLLFPRSVSSFVTSACLISYFIYIVHILYSVLQVEIWKLLKFTIF